MEVKTNRDGSCTVTLIDNQTGSITRLSDSNEYACKLGLKGTIVRTASDALYWMQVKDTEIRSEIHA